MSVLAQSLSEMAEELLNPWVIFGFGAQFMFFMRFVIQWIASERRRRSYVPVVFWYFSLAGGIMLFTYAIHRRDPVFILGQGLGCFIYIRNLILIYGRRNRLRNHRGGTLEGLMDDGIGGAEATPPDVADGTAKANKTEMRATGDPAATPPPQY